MFSINKISIGIMLHAIMLPAFAQFTLPDEYRRHAYSANLSCVDESANMVSVTPALMEGNAYRQAEHDYPSEVARLSPYFAVTQGLIAGMFRMTVRIPYNDTYRGKIVAEGYVEETYKRVAWDTHSRSVWMEKPDNKKWYRKPRPDKCYAVQTLYEGQINDDRWWIDADTGKLVEQIPREEWSSTSVLSNLPIPGTIDVPVPAPHWPTSGFTGARSYIGPRVPYTYGTPQYLPPIYPGFYNYQYRLRLPR